MALRLIRQESESPNVTNTDDARMVRYAYGGYNGYIKNRGTELDRQINGTVFKVMSGVLNLQGWEAEIDANGVEISVNGSVNTRYFSVFYEVNAGTDSASIKAEYSESSYPSIDPGDDLTKTTNGIARLLLYQFTVKNNIITEASIQKKVDAIDFVPKALVEGTMASKFAKYADGEEGKGSIGNRIDSKLDSDKINTVLNNNSWSNIMRPGLYSLCARYNSKLHYFLIEVQDLTEDCNGPIVRDEDDELPFAAYTASTKSFSIKNTAGDYGKNGIRLIIDYSE